MSSAHSGWLEYKQFLALCHIWGLIFQIFSDRYFPILSSCLIGKLIRTSQKTQREPSKDFQNAPHPTLIFYPANSRPLALSAC